ncbi:hypothetical protein HQQ81_07105 [Microbacteriaceae bacterium VKM Ac-2854]|nr:hypothetical protein [Microbacteriaceae bacterium VKM Ac-2854]
MRTTTWSDPPRLSDAVTIDEPRSVGDPWILSFGGVPRARVGRDAASFAALLDGRLSIRAAAAAARPPLNTDRAESLVVSLAAAGLLDGAERREKRWRRLHYRRPMSLQLTLIDATRPATAIARAMRARPVRIVGGGIAVAIVILGGISAGVHGAEIAKVGTEPLPFAALLAVGLAFVLAGAVHEAGHAVALAAYGGRPHRAGVMLFYFAPAFFCDVTDGWRLGDRRARLVIALAGPSVHLVLAGGAVIALSVAEPGEGRSALACFAVVAAVNAATNLTPFIKLDGYLALVAVLDRPFLRDAAMRAVRDAALRVLGANVPRPSAALFAFGVGCRMLPVLLLGWGFVRAAPLLTITVPGAVVALVLAAGLLALLVATAARFARAARAARIRPLRLVVAGFLAVGLLSAVALTPASDRVEGGYVVRDGQVFVVRLEQDQPVAIGAEVDLHSNGILMHRSQSDATVAGPPVTFTVPAAAFVPLTGLGDTEAVGYRLDVDEPGALDPVGAASILEGPTTLGARALDLFMNDALARLGIGR